MAEATIISKWYVDNVLTDATSMVLSDPTAAFGVQRNDTLATVVADGTAMTKIATGIYRHRFTEPAAGLVYRYWVETVYASATYFQEENLVGGTDVSSSKTAAVQRLLVLCGMQASMSNTNSRNALIAEEFIDREDVEVQTIGWPENTEHKVVITPDSSDDTVSTDEFGTDVLAIYPRIGGSSQHMKIVRRGLNLWREDWSQSTGTTMVNTFDGDIDMTKIRQLAFSDLPEYLTRFIIARAARQFFAAVASKQIENARRQVEVRQNIEQEWLQAKAEAEQTRTMTGNPRTILNTSFARSIRGQQFMVPWR
jgi:hypothetical protein